jgi:hypothetical protein
MSTFRLRALVLLFALGLLSLAGSQPAVAIGSCTAQTPCLPKNSGFISTLGLGGEAFFEGSTAAPSPGTVGGVVVGINSYGAGNSRTAGVAGYYSGTGSGTGVLGYTFSNASEVSGMYGRLLSTAPGGNSAGVRGEVESGANGAYGVWGGHSSANGTAAGVLGNTASDDANAVGVEGVILPTNPGAGSKAVWGYNAGTGANGIGVYGQQQGSGMGVYGTTVGGVGVLGTTTAGGGIGVLGYRPNGFAGLFIGNLAVTGTLTKGAGAFRIDHPLDPAGKYLQHSFVESPDMKNVYDGVVTTDGRGFATVRLPRYFQALNRSFRYQLTIVGARGWRARVVKEIALNRFTIQSDAPRVKVSWQVTGIRKDRYANAHRIQPELSKPASQQGTYLAPELYGQPRSASTFKGPNPSLGR